MEYNLYELQNEMSKVLKKKRFYHVLGVQTTSFSLAIHYNCNIENAILAGLLHDCAKDLSDEELISECEKNHIEISLIERSSPYLLHGKLGAYYVKHNYGIKNEDILNSILYHTTGKPNMSLLEKIIFVADYIEPNRSPEQIPELDQIRKLVFTDIDKAILRIIKNTLRYLKENEVTIDTLTIDTYNYYKKNSK